MSNHLQANLKTLMHECHMDDAKLSRKTGIPASTISRIRNNDKANPTAATLLPIAEFFDVTIDQLLGASPIPNTRLPGTRHHVDTVASSIPVLDWDWICGWIKKDIQSFKSKLNEWLTTEHVASELSFALRVPGDSLGIAFRKGSYLLFDPRLTPKDGDLVLMKLSDSGDVVVRKILIDGENIYIRSVNPEFKETRLLQKQHYLLGVLFETRYSINTTDNQQPSRSLPALLQKLVPFYQATE